MPEGPTALPHFILLSVLQIWVANTLGGGPAVGVASGSSLLSDSNSTLGSLVLYPCLHLAIFNEHKFTSIVAYTDLANDVLVCAIHLFGNTENTITIWGLSGEFPFPCLRLCQPDGVLYHVLGVVVGGLYLLGLSHLASLLQGLVGLEPCTLLLYSFIHLFIPPPGFRSPLVVLGDRKRWWQYTAEGLSALTKLYQRDLQYQLRHQH